MTGAPSGSAGRVAAVHRQARRTLALAAVFAVGAALATVVARGTGSWLPLHLFLVGALLLAISGATQLFAVTWAAGPAPADAAARVQRALVAAGAAGIAAARELSLPTWVLALSAASVVAGLVLLAALLVRVVAHGVQRRFDATLRAYRGRSRSPARGRRRRGRPAVRAAGPRSGVAARLVPGCSSAASRPR